MEGNLGELTFASRCTYCNPIPRFEELGFHDGVVNLGFKDIEEAIPTNLLPSFRPLDHCSGRLTESARFWWHLVWYMVCSEPTKKSWGTLSSQSMMEGQLRGGADERNDIARARAPNELTSQPGSHRL